MAYPVELCSEPGATPNGDYAGNLLNLTTDTLQLVSSETLLRGVPAVKVAGSATNQLKPREAVRSGASNRKAGKP